MKPQEYRELARQNTEREVTKGRGVGNIYILNREEMGELLMMSQKK